MMEKVFFGLVYKKQYLLAVLILFLYTLDVKSDQQKSSLSLSYKSKDHFVFRNLDGASLSIRKSNYFQYISYQNNQFLINIIESPEKIQTVFRANKDNFEYNVVHNQYKKNLNSEIGFIGYKNERRFLLNDQENKCESSKKVDFVKLETALQEISSLDLNQHFDFSNCEGEQERFYVDFKSKIERKINDFKKCENATTYNEIINQNPGLYTRFANYNDLLINLVEDFKKGPKKIEFKCDDELNEVASYKIENNKKIIKFNPVKKDPNNRDLSVVDVLINHELQHVSGQEKNACISENLVELLSNICTQNNQPNFVNDALKKDAACGNGSKENSLAINDKEVRILAEQITAPSSTNIPQTTANTLSQSAQAQVGEISQIARGVASEVSAYPSTDPTLAQKPPLSNPVKEQVGRAMDRMEGVGNSFSNFINNLSSNATSMAPAQASLGTTGTAAGVAAAAGLMQKALSTGSKNTSSTNVTVLSAQGVERQLGPALSNKQFDLPAQARDLLINDPAILANMKAEASRAKATVDVQQDSTASGRVDTTQNQIARVNNLSRTNGMASNQINDAKVDTKIDTQVSGVSSGQNQNDQTRSIAAIGQATRVNVQQVAIPNNNNVGMNTPPVASSQVARLLTDTRMNTLKGENYKIITKYYGEEQFANVLKDRKTVVVDKDNNRIVGDAVSARNCFQDTGREIVKLKACPQK